MASYLDKFGVKTPDRLVIGKCFHGVESIKTIESKASFTFLLYLEEQNDCAATRS